MNTCCGNCKTLSKDLKRCTGCFEIYYCSKDCQKQHWRSGHYITCKGKTQTNGTSQKQDTGRPRHKASNQRSNDGQSTSEARTANKQHMCKACQKEGEVKVCKRCKLATYCSKECQTADWPSHKEDCNRQRKTVNPNPTQDWNGSEQTGTNSRFTGDGQERHAQSPSFPGSVPFMFPGMGIQQFDPFFFNDGADMSLRYATSEEEWERARQMVKLRREFPLLEVIDDIDRIPHENFFGIRYRNGCVFLAFVWRYQADTASMSR